MYPTLINATKISPASEILTNEISLGTMAQHMDTSSEVMPISTLDDNSLQTMRNTASGSLMHEVPVSLTSQTKMSSTANNTNTTDAGTTQQTHVILSRPQQLSNAPSSILGSAYVLNSEPIKSAHFTSGIAHADINGDSMHLTLDITLKKQTPSNSNIPIYNQEVVKEIVEQKNLLNSASLKKPLQLQEDKIEREVHTCQAKPTTAHVQCSNPAIQPPLHQEVLQCNKNAMIDGCSFQSIKLSAGSDLSESKEHKSVASSNPKSNTVDIVISNEFTKECSDSLLLKNNIHDKGYTHISNAVTLTIANVNVTPKPAKSEIAFVTLEKKNKSKYSDTRQTSIDERPSLMIIPHTGEHKQESLLKTKPIHRLMMKCTSPREKRSKSLNSAAALAEAAVERRFSTASEGKSKTSDEIEKTDEIADCCVDYDEEWLLKNTDVTILPDNTKVKKNYVTDETEQNKQKCGDAIQIDVTHFQDKEAEEDSTANMGRIQLATKKVQEQKEDVDFEIAIQTETAVDNKTIGKSLYCDEQLLISSTSTSSVSTNNNTSHESLSNQSSNLATVKSPTTNLKAAPMMTTAHTDLTAINSYASVLEMLSTFNMLSWKERIGTARGTSMRFQLNEFNLLQVHERCQSRYRIHTAFEKPIYERESHSTENTDPLLYLCRRCNCHGPAGDFLAPEFCSLECLKRDSRKRQRDFVGVVRKRQRKDISATTVASLTPAAIQNLSNNAESLLVKKYFRWSTYITGKMGDVAAPVDLFLNPFPSGPNNFKISMKLEAIDPDNCSLFCVCTVIDIQGYRLNLGFDGYDRMYSFWVNADSMDIFPPGWCAKTNRILQPPRGYEAATFNWPAYLIKEKAIAAPRQLFTHLNSSSMPSRNPFRIGMHLEAEDLNETGKLCVATVADVLDDRLRIHFDGWDDCYDYWVDTNSPYIHPCGWHEGRQHLIVPPDFESTSFSWPEYINEHSSGLMAPQELFNPRDPITFQPRMKLEVVDPRNAMLIRPATVVGRKGHRVKLHLDMWPLEYCFWLEDDSPDLHPLGWCNATAHYLEPPPGYQATRASLMPCVVLGCRGIGNARQLNLSTHSTQEACPYATENWSVKLEKEPRLENNEIERTTTAKANVEQIALQKRDMSRNEALKIRRCEPKSATVGAKSCFADEIMDRLRILDNMQTRRSLQDKMQSADAPLETLIELNSADDDDIIELKPELKLYSKIGEVLSEGAIHLTIPKKFLCDYGPRLKQNFIVWQQNMQFNFDTIRKNPLYWSSTESCKFVETILNCSKTAQTFALQDIDGAALLSLQQTDLTNILDLKLGPAVKLFSHIIQLRTWAVTKFNVIEIYQRT